MKTILSFVCFFSVLMLFPNTLLAQETAADKVSADVDCVSTGALNGETMYRYDVTLKNLTQKKLKVNYTVYLKAGDAVKKQHSHSTILIPEEELVEFGESKMKTEDWDKVTSFRVEWTVEDL